jgi:hypothetical protein
MFQHFGVIPSPLIGSVGLVATHGGGLFDKIAGAAIRWGTNSPVNHAFMYVGDGEIIEAVATVKLSPVTEYENITWIDPIGMTTAQGQAAVKYCRDSLGEHYNAIDIVAIALAQRRLGGTVDGDEWWVKRLSDDHMEICSQLVTNAWRVTGIDPFPGKLSGLVSPGDLYNLALKG